MLSITMLAQEPYFAGLERDSDGASICGPVCMISQQNFDIVSMGSLQASICK